MRLTSLCCLALLCLTATTDAQAPAARDTRPFRSDIEGVEIDVRVVDENGRLVPGLQQRDFEIYENGVRQELRAFSVVQLPFSPRPASEPASEVDTATNRTPFDGRLYVVVLDDLHTHPLNSPRVRHVVRQFLDKHLAANDRAAIVLTSGRIDASQELTADRRLLYQALDRFQGRKVRSSTLERIDQYYMTRDMRDRESNRERTERVDDPLNFERGHQARMALETLGNSARWLGTVPARRKAVLFVSEGIDYDLSTFMESSSYASTVIETTRDVIAHATRGNVNIYAVDPRGLTNLGPESIELASLPVDSGLRLGTETLQDELRLSQDSLRTLAEETGGFAVVNANDFAGAFDRIVRDVSEYYVLGYQPANTKRDGKFRKVEVRVNRPGLKVIARRGYFAPGRSDVRRAEATETNAPDLRPLLDSPYPVSGLPLDSQAAVFRGANGKASALLTLEVGPDVGFTEKDGLQRARVDVSALAISSDGKVYGGEQRGIELKLTPERLPLVKRHGFRTLSRLELPAGRYQVRIAARDEASGRGGSVIHDVAVPDFAKEPLAVSSILLASGAATQALTTKPDAELKDALPLPPTTLRAFDSRDTVVLFAEVYDNRTRGTDPVLLQTVVTDANGKVAFRSEEKIERFTFDPSRRAFRHRLRLPVKDFAPGEYIVKVEAAGSADEARAAREARFTVRAASTTE